MIDYLVIGHIAQDLTPEGYRLGGTVAYAALTARALGLRVGVVTAAGPDAVMTGLENVALHCIPSQRSTTFENRYEASGRVQTLHARAQPLTLEHVPADWRRAAVVHLGPIAREVDPDLVNAFPGAFIGLTPQGWMRRWDEAGRVMQGDWVEADSLLAAASATVVSVEDIADDWRLVERWAAVARILVVTQGEEGATVFWHGNHRHFPAPQVNIVDPTGAGDIFAACFFSRLWQTGDAWAAARFAVAQASDSVTRVGIDGVPQTAQLGDKIQKLE